MFENSAFNPRKDISDAKERKEKTMDIYGNNPLPIHLAFNPNRRL
jgi:hypothetical protein